LSRMASSNLVVPQRHPAGPEEMTDDSPWVKAWRAGRTVA
jgi:hypothetical protein